MNWFVKTKAKTFPRMDFRSAVEIQDKLLRGGVMSFIWRVE